MSGERPKHRHAGIASSLSRHQPLRSRRLAATALGEVGSSLTALPGLLLLVDSTYFTTLFGGTNLHHCLSLWQAIGH
jgi:hypothetical protein